MKPATIKELKKELEFHSSEDLLEICLRLSKFKKENKELITYLLFNSGNESEYIEKVKEEVEEQFLGLNTSSFYYIKKGVRRILRDIKKYSRYSGKKETEAALLIFFLFKLKNFSPSIKGNKMLENIYDRQRALLRKTIGTLHEDLQFDFEKELEDLSL